jgi:RNase adapter protein RapZ
MTNANKRKIFIITGMSGAGRSQALKIFEDFGFYCVDNLPIKLLPKFLEYIKKRKDLENIALGIDIREGSFIKDTPKILEGFKKEKINFQILFFDASDNVLVQRFSQTRHRHPLGKNITPAIKQERRILRELKAVSDKEIDTSTLTLGELKETLSRLLNLTQSSEMKISVISFGFKHGIPIDADIVMDVRFLKNPNYETKLKNKTGLNKPVVDFINRETKAKEFLNKLLEMIKFLLPSYVKEGKSYLEIAIGCTGGRHRSVYLANRLVEGLRKTGLSVSEFHRDIRKQ